MVDEPTVVVGRITRAHGIRGEVAVQVRSDEPTRWRPGATVFRDGRELTVEGVRGQAGDRLIVRFAGVDDRSAAESLRGEVTIPRAWLPELPPGQWWPHEIQGCRVVSASGRDLGRVTDVIANPANDIWVAVSDDGIETLIPVVHDLLVEVDVEGKLIRVADVAGLTAPG